MASKKVAPSLLTLGALGIVFGDIGTSPLYALRAVFSTASMPVNQATVTGIISLVIWALILIVTIKYILLVMQADNKGEGGMVALMSLVRQLPISRRELMVLLICGLAGMSLFYGDSIITPAISVLSAVEGAKLIAPGIEQYITAITVVILLGLFALQARGTAAIGKLFGPIMVIWFAVSAIGGISQILKNPIILESLLPTTAIAFVQANPLVSFAALGGIILVITGVEALYADMGHFGRPAITRAWIYIALPALTLTYLGQGALILRDPSTIDTVYFSMFPSYAQLSVVILATLATLIASQAVISGAFSLTRQAAQLGFAPRFLTRHTSTTQAGQIYLPAINWGLAAIVSALVIAFGSSASLAYAFGMAVSGTILITSMLFFVVVMSWQRLAKTTGALIMIFFCIELLFVAANVQKITEGAWLPLAIGIVIFTILFTWHRARTIIGTERYNMEGALDEFIKTMQTKHITRIPGSAIYIGHHAGRAPLALHDSVDQLHELHERVVVVNVESENIAHVPARERVIFDDLGSLEDGVSHVTLRFGYKDLIHVPHELARLRDNNAELDFNLNESVYFISNSEPIVTSNKRMPGWQKRLYVIINRNTRNTANFLRLPLDRTVEMTSFIKF